MNVNINHLWQTRVHKIEKEGLCKLCRTTQFSFGWLNIYASHLKVLFSKSCTKFGANDDRTTVKLKAQAIIYWNLSGSNNSSWFWKKQNLLKRFWFDKTERRLNSIFLTFSAQQVFDTRIAIFPGINLNCKNYSAILHRMKAGHTFVFYFWDTHMVKLHFRKSLHLIDCSVYLRFFGRRWELWLRLKILKELMCW